MPLKKILCTGYGKQQVYGVVDPRSQTEDIVLTLVKATRYGIKNLKYIMK